MGHCPSSPQFYCPMYPHIDILQRYGNKKLTTKDNGKYRPNKQILHFLSYLEHIYKVFFAQISLVLHLSRVV